MSDVTVVITSFNRLDLLTKTIESFNKFNKYPIEEFIIVENCGCEQMHEELRRLYPNYTMILNEHNIGLPESIDKAYAQVKTPYVFHSEDDYEYYREGFIERSLMVLNNDPSIMQVWIRRGETQDDTDEYIPSIIPKNVLGMPVLPELHNIFSIPYYILGQSGDWHGFAFQCGLRSMDAYKKVAPYSQYFLNDPSDFITWKECAIGLAYHKLGYKAALLPEGYARHIGYGRSTFGLLNH